MKYLTKISPNWQAAAKMPPDWVAAEKHRKASLVYDESKLEEKELERCPCC